MLKMKVHFCAVLSRDLFKDQFLQVWKSKIDQSSKLYFYTQIKVHHCLESYLDILKVNKFRNALASFRVSCHVLEIEKGRNRGIERENRKCRFCPNSIEDEYHFMLTCKQYGDLRREYLPSKYFELPNLHKLDILMSSKQEAVIKTIALYIYHANFRRSNLPANRLQ